VIVRNLSTTASREFWRSAEETSRAIQDWPPWMRAGINVAAVRVEPRVPDSAKVEEPVSWGP
jgi:hypothetical protein